MTRQITTSDSVEGDIDQQKATSSSTDPRGDRPTVSILILNYNGREELIECIKSFQETNYSKLSVVVVDNGSSDGSAELVARRFPFVRTVQLGANYGFARAYNSAVDEIDSEYLFFVNNDITAQSPTWLREMIKVAESDSSIGAVGPKLVMTSNPNLLDMIGGIVYRWMGCSPLGHGEIDSGQYDNPPREVFFLGGGALLIRKSLFLKIGRFDSDIFAYAEDLDICWRLRLEGYRIEYCPRAVLLHKGSSLWRKFSSRKLRLSQQNFFCCCLKNYSITSVIKEVPILIFLNMVGSLAASVLDRRADLFLAALSSLKTTLFRVPTTLSKRIRVQASRVTEERGILAAMGSQRLMSLSMMKMKSSRFRQTPPRS